MSVMLTATKNALRKKSARPTKSAKNETIENERPAKPVQTSGAHVSANNVKMWQWVMDDQQMNLVFRKDTMEIWVNDSKVDVIDSFSEDSDGAALDFICVAQKGRITTCRRETGELDQVLTINGIVIE